MMNLATIKVLPVPPRHDAENSFAVNRLPVVARLNRSDATPGSSAARTGSSTKLGGVVEVGFDKLGGLVEGVHIFCQRDGDAGFGYLASETHSPYIDNRPLLVAGKPETRQYKAVFFLGKSELGLPSDVVPATAKP